jgi:hypothetical protein
MRDVSLAFKICNWTDVQYRPIPPLQGLLLACRAYICMLALPVCSYVSIPAFTSNIGSTLTAACGKTLASADRSAAHSDLLRKSATRTAELKICVAYETFLGTLRNCLRRIRGTPVRISRYPSIRDQRIRGSHAPSGSHAQLVIRVERVCRHVGTSCCAFRRTEGLGYSR